jgi:hypothetical protein
MNYSGFASLKLTTATFDELKLNKGIFVCLLHAKRIPPHIGIIINSQFHSLTIKGAEPNVSVKALLKTISQRQIETIILKVVSHPVYSLDHLDAIFLEILKKYPVIKSNEVTCLSPIKEFFNEYYALGSYQEEIIFSFLNKLNNNSFILEAYSLNLTIGNNSVEIPLYSQSELSDKIKTIREEYYND